MPPTDDHAAPPAPRDESRRNRTGRRGTTLTDVARLAGVSPMSASRALNKPEQVSLEILAKVNAAVASTGYVTNRLAGSLASNRTHLVAAVVPSIAGPVFQDMVQSLIGELSARGYQLMLGQAGYGEGMNDDLLATIIGRRPDGLVLAGVVPTAIDRQRLIAAAIPVVETWDLVPDPIDMVVGFSHEAIAGEVARFLTGKGCRRLAFIGGNHARALRRASAFAQAAAACAPEARVVQQAVEAPASVRAGRNALARILDQQPDTDAVFCSSDMLALGVLTEAGQRGLHVPGALKVIGFGDSQFSADIAPALSSVHIDAQAIGRHAAAFIVERCERPSAAPARIDVGFSLVQRETS